MPKKFAMLCVVGRVDKSIVEVGRWYPSSKTCHCCGYLYRNLTLAEGLRIYKGKIGLSSPEFTHADCPPVDDRPMETSVLRSGGRLEREKTVFH